MLTVFNAWRLVCRRTGGNISRTTFYRWINEGRVNALRLGYGWLVPLPEVERIIALCVNGERL